MDNPHGYFCNLENNSRLYVIPSPAISGGAAITESTFLLSVSREEQGREREMRPVNVSSAAGFRNRNSPMPYLFVGVIAMLGLIGAALIILVCSFRKHRDSMSPDSVKKPPEPVITPLEREPKVVVIMAGDDLPTFLAEPISRASSLQQQARVLPSSSTFSSS